MTLLRNPVIRGFAPDPSMVRVGDWFYVATSSFEWFPTIPIHRSRDLAHWEYAGHVEGAAPDNSLAGVPDSGGIWAPSLSWDGERFWVVHSIVRSVGTPYFDADTYVCTAPEASGAWTAPRRIASHGFDPALFHEDGRLWLLNLQNDHRPGGRRFAGIVLTELDRETLASVGATRLLLQHERLIEGPKLTRRDGWYLLVLAEGGTGFEHGVRVARSRHITGPYELDDRPLLTSRDDPSLELQKAGHGELVRLPDGTWVLSHLASRPLPTPNGPRCPLGRETAIQPVTWDPEGWPRLRHGGTHPEVEVEIPAWRESVGGGGIPTPAGFEAEDEIPTPPDFETEDRIPTPPRPAAQNQVPALPDFEAEDEIPTPPDFETEGQTPTPTPPRPAAQNQTPAPPGPGAEADVRTHPAPVIGDAVPPQPAPPTGTSAVPAQSDRPAQGSVPARPTPAEPPAPAPAARDSAAETPGPTHPRPRNQPPVPTPPAPTPDPPATTHRTPARPHPTPATTPLGWPWSTLRAAPDPSWADPAARPGWIRLRGRQGPESRWAHSLLAQRITEHRVEAEVTVEARPESFTQAAGLVLWYHTESYLALDLTWAEPEGEGQRGQQWRGGGRTVLSLVERDEGGTRQVALVEVGAEVEADEESAFTLGVTVADGVACFWFVGSDGTRTAVGPGLDFTQLSDDAGSKLRFTGAMAGIHAVDLVDAAFTADFTGFRLRHG